jgi:ketosteroid isomerase-like protein
MDLPTAITTYLTAHNARDVDGAIASYAPDAAVTDEGRTHHGTAEIRAWLTGAAAQYSYTTELIAATQLDQERFDVCSTWRATSRAGWSTCITGSRCATPPSSGW